jgi:hypothetical protein
MVQKRIEDMYEVRVKKSVGVHIRRYSRRRNKKLKKHEEGEAAKHRSINHHTTLRSYILPKKKGKINKRSDYLAYFSTAACPPPRLQKSVHAGLQV